MISRFDTRLAIVNRAIILSWRFILDGKCFLRVQDGKPFFVN